MGLGRKNLAYSLALAGILMLFLLGYFAYMLPSLYVDYMMEQNLQSIRQQHNFYMDNGTYEGVPVKNSVACFSLEIPYDGESMKVTGKSYSLEIAVKDGRLKGLISEICKKLTQWEPAGEKESGQSNSRDIQGELNGMVEIFREEVGKDREFPVEVRLLYRQDMNTEFYNESVKIHPFSEQMVVIETGVEDTSNRYMNYIAVERGGDRLVISCLPVVAPEMSEIRPIVMQSIPMLGAVLLLMVLLFSQIYSGGIVAPIEDLVCYAERMKRSLAEPGAIQRGAIKPVERQKGDEVDALADTLADFYGQIRENMARLAEKNRELEEENKRQEIFLRASSHQLKTPVAAALLLVDGMMNGVGKYQDVKVYLPKVKEQLLSMRKMVEDILYLNHCAENMEISTVGLGTMVKKGLQAYQVSVLEKKLTVEVPEGEGPEINTDEQVFMQVLDNLLSNAVKYTPSGGCIRLIMTQSKDVGETLKDCRGESKWELRLENYGVTIPVTLLPHIMEPFVSGSHEGNNGGHGHGLGLYIASYYAGKLGLTLLVNNGEMGDCVVATLMSHKS